MEPDLKAYIQARPDDMLLASLMQSACLFSSFSSPLNDLTVFMFVKAFSIISPANTKILRSFFIKGEAERDVNAKTRKTKGIEAKMTRVKTACLANAKMRHAANVTK